MRYKAQKKFSYSWECMIAVQINLDEFLGAARSLPHRLLYSETSKMSTTYSLK